MVELSMNKTFHAVEVEFNDDGGYENLAIIKSH